MEEKLTGINFFQAAEMAAGTEMIIQHTGTGERYKWTRDGKRNVMLWIEGGIVCWPDFEQQKQKAWSVKPEKPEEVFVYGFKDDQGSCWIISSIDGGPSILIKDHEYFQRKIRKYRIIPADEPLIPWKPFVPEDMPNERLKVVVFRENQMGIQGMLGDVWAGSSFHYSNPQVISHYCLRSEFPKNIFPEDG